MISNILSNKKETYEEYDKICKNLVEGLKTFNDEDKNETVRESINRSDQIFVKKITCRTY